MSQENAERVYSYLTEFGKLGAHPYQLAKALNLAEDAVMQALGTLEREGKVHIRSSNREWKARSFKRNQITQPSFDVRDPLPSHRGKKSGPETTSPAKI